MVESYENRPKDTEIKFSHNQVVEVTKGFYRGYTGLVSGYAVKDKKVYYNVNLESINTVLLVDETDLREKKKKFLGVF